MSEKESKAPLTPAEILQRGDYYDLLLTANDSSEELKFHRPMLASRSTFFKAMLEDEKLTSIPLNCKLNILKHIRSMVYDMPFDMSKLPIVEVWEAYIFVVQYDFKLLKDFSETFPNLLINKDYVELLSLLKVMEATQHGKPFINGVIDRLLSVMSAIALDPIYCENASECCTHTEDSEYRCDLMATLCCRHRAESPIHVLAHRRKILSNLHMDIKMFKDSIQQEIMYQLWESAYG